MRNAGETLDLEGVAALFGAEAETVAQYARSGELPGTRIGKGWIFLKDDALAFLRERIDRDTEARRAARSQHEHLGPTNEPRHGDKPSGVVFDRQPRRRRTVLPTLPGLPSRPQ